MNPVLIVILIPVTALCVYYMAWLVSAAWHSARQWSHRRRASRMLAQYLKQKDNNHGNSQEEDPSR